MIALYVREYDVFLTSLSLSLRIVGSSSERVLEPIFSTQTRTIESTVESLEAGKLFRLFII